MKTPAPSLLSTLVLGFVGCSTPPPDGGIVVAALIKSYAARTNWMGGLAGTIGGRALRNVVLPGAHDSGTAAITATAEVTIDAPEWMQTISGVGSIFSPVGLVASWWSRAQGNVSPNS